MQSYYIVIRGPLGVGKTVVAKKLASELDADYMSIDSVLEKNKLDRVGRRHVPLKNLLAANKLVIHAAKRKLKDGKTIVSDGNFYLKGQIDNLTRSLSPAHYVFTLRASLRACIERDRKRNKTYGEDAARAVYKLAGKYDFGKAIDTENKTVDQVINEIIRNLNKGESLR